MVFYEILLDISSIFFTKIGGTQHGVKNTKWKREKDE